ncbi:MAG: DUF1761 domain-containing protein [Kineosporiaceae bacterium]|jgi:hypothetical protein
MDVLAIVVATVVAFLLSGAYYALVPLPQRPAAQQEPAAPRAAVQAATELLRSAAVAGLVVGLMQTAGWTSPAEGALLGLALWVLPVVLLVGSVVHEGTPARAAVAHGGDWLIKLLAIGALVGALG